MCEKILTCWSSVRPSSQVNIEAFGSNFSLCLFLKYFKEEPIVAHSWATTNVTVFNADNSTEDIQLKTLEQVGMT